MPAGEEDEETPLLRDFPGSEKLTEAAVGRIVSQHQAGLWEALGPVASATLSLPVLLAH